MTSIPGPSSALRIFRTIVFFTIGAVLVFGAVWLTVTQVRFLDTAATAHGHVVNADYGSTHPQIEFVTAEGTPVSYRQGGLIYGYGVGRSVSVRYRTDAPQVSAELDDFGALWGVQILMLILGGCFVWAGVTKA